VTTSQFGKGAGKNSKGLDRTEDIKTVWNGTILLQCTSVVPMS